MKKSKQNSLVSLTKIRTLLKEIPWNPRKPGPMSIISDVGSAEFYELRAIEEIQAARLIRNTNIDKIESIRLDGERCYRQHMIKAIQLLLLARLNT